MSDDIPTPLKVADRHPVLAAGFERDAATEEKRFAYLADRRDKMIERLLFGCLSINGASIVGLLAALGGKGEAATWIGLDQKHSIQALLLFVVGVLSAGAATIAEGNRYRTEAANGYERQLKVAALAASFEARDTKESCERTEALMKRFHEAPLVGFQYSKTAIVLQNLSGAAWVAGILIPLLHALGIG